MNNLSAALIETQGWLPRAKSKLACALLRSVRKGGATHPVNSGQTKKPCAEPQEIATQGYPCAADFTVGFVQLARTSPCDGDDRVQIPAPPVLVGHRSKDGRPNDHAQGSHPPAALRRCQAGAVLITSSASAQSDRGSRRRTPCASSDQQTSRTVHPWRTAHSERR